MWCTLVLLLNTNHQQPPLREINIAQLPIVITGTAGRRDGSPNACRPQGKLSFTTQGKEIRNCEIHIRNQRITNYQINTIKHSKPATGKQNTKKCKLAFQSGPVISE